MNTTNQNIARACDSVGEVCTMSAVRAGASEAVAVPLTALHLIEDAAQAHDQCRAVVHMALALAEVYVARAAILSNSAKAPVEIIGQSSAETMEYLGDLLSNMDAVSEDDEWLDPIFEAAKARWPVVAPTGGESGGAADERAAFEAWANDQGFVLQRVDLGDDYRDLRTQGPWEAWQARAALQSVKPQGGAE